MSETRKFRRRRVTAEKGRISLLMPRAVREEILDWCEADPQARPMNTILLEIILQAIRQGRQEADVTS